MQAKNYPINMWANDDKPREKLLSKSPAALTDSELLAILLRCGPADSSAIDLAREVLKLGQNNLNALAKFTPRELMKVRGIGLAKACSIIAALEIGRRRQGTRPAKKAVVKNSREVAAYLQSVLRDLPHEVFAVIYLNKAGRVNHFEVISQGGITGTIADPRLILKQALAEEAVSIILCHNHPSGSLQPSQADEELTAKIKEAAGYLDIKLLDHIIVSEEGHFSFADKGML